LVPTVAKAAPKKAAKQASGLPISEMVQAEKAPKVPKIAPALPPGAAKLVAAPSPEPKLKNPAAKTSKKPAPIPKDPRTAVNVEGYGVQNFLQAAVVNWARPVDVFFHPLMTCRTISLLLKAKLGLHTIDLAAAGQKCPDEMRAFKAGLVHDATLPVIQNKRKKPKPGLRPSPTPPKPRASPLPESQNTPIQVDPTNPQTSPKIVVPSDILLASRSEW